MGPVTGLREFLSMVVRRGPLIAAVLVAGMLVSLVVALSRPQSFEAITVIQLEPAMMNGGAAEGAAALSETASRLRLIEQRLMSRSNVLDMMDRFEIGTDLPGMPVEERIAQFRRDARVDFVPSLPGAPGGLSGVSALVLTVRAGDAATAADLANDMADQILAGDRSTRAARLDDLIAALQGEDDRVGARIAATDAEAERFREAHPDALPSNIELLAAERARLQDQQVALNREGQALDRERLALQVGDDAGTEGGSVIQQLRNLEVELAQARRSLPDDHPEVRRIAGAVERLRSGQAAGVSPGVQSQIALIDAQSDSLGDERRRIDARLAQIDAAIAEMPQVGARLQELERRRALLVAQRQAVAGRLNAAQLDARLIAGDHGERMVVLERAAAPELPIGSGRRRTAALGLIVSVMAALGAAFALEVANPVLRSPRQLERALGVAPIAVARFRPGPAEATAIRTRNLQSVTILAAGLAIAAMIVLLRP